MNRPIGYLGGKWYFLDLGIGWGAEVAANVRGLSVTRDSACSQIKVRGIRVTIQHRFHVTMQKSVIATCFC